MLGLPTSQQWLHQCAAAVLTIAMDTQHAKLLRQEVVDGLRQLLSERLGWDVDVSELGDDDDEDAPVVVEL